MLVVIIVQNEAKTAWFVYGCPKPDEGTGRHRFLHTITTTRKQARDWAVANGFQYAPQ